MRIYVSSSVLLSINLCFQDPELNTFQAVYVTDGETAYLLYLYKNGAMTWRFDRWRRIEIGYTNGDALFEFEGMAFTAATTTLDVDVGNAGTFHAQSHPHSFTVRKRRTPQETNFHSFIEFRSRL